VGHILKSPMGHVNNVSHCPLKYPHINNRDLSNTVGSIVGNTDSIVAFIDSIVALRDSIVVLIDSIVEP